MTMDTDRILTLQNKLKQAMAGTAGSPETGDADSAASTSVSHPVQDFGEVAAAERAVMTLIELVMARDEYIYHELMHLQRTLSRQSFRGAESARRLVRRLARRAEQNIQDLQAGHRELLTDRGLRRDACDLTRHSV